MKNREKSPLEYSVFELDRELIARGARISDEKRYNFKDKEGTPARDAVMKHVKQLYDSKITPNPNNALSHINTSSIVRALMLKTRKLRGRKGLWGDDDRLDMFEIKEESIQKNASSLVVVCCKRDLIDMNDGTLILNVKNYGSVFNLCNDEPFYNQPILAGHSCTGFLIGSDLIVTAGHFTYKNSIADIRIVFGFHMLNALTPSIRIPYKNIYKVGNIVHIVCNPRGRGADWALIKLNRKVEEHHHVMLSEKAIYSNQPVYTLGHPCGLPLKLAASAKVLGISDTCFSVDLNVYSGNSGSPVFDQRTHKVIGIVVRGDTQDFRWTRKGWLSVVYPNPVIRSQQPECTRISELKNLGNLL